MMKQFYVLCSMLLLLCVGASAQSTELLASATKTSHNDDLNVREQVHPVSGTVTDENGEPFIGATVAVEGTTIGTITNAEGRYSLDAPNGNSKLIISFVGYATQEINISNRTIVDVGMEPDLVALSEVVVTALGIEKDSKKLGYSVTAVNTEDLVKNRTTNVMESLEGRVAGMNITPPAAGAGASTQIRLRGQAAFDIGGASSTPLIVINGLPIDQGTRSASGGQQRDRGDNLLNINPDDVESMTVLKGSTAAALYGSRAANGAIIITTKSGKLNQGIGVEFSSNFTTQKALDFFEFQTMYGLGDGGQKPSSTANAAANGQYGWGARLDGSMVPSFDGIDRPYVAHPNRLTDYYTLGTNFTNTIALSGGGANGSFRASFSNTDAQGIEPNNQYKRKIANVGINHNITEKLKMSININYTRENQINPPQIGTQGAGSMNFLTRMSLSVPLEAFEMSAIGPNGTEARTSGFSTLQNPYYARQAGQYYENIRNRLLATTTLRYAFTDWLYLQGRFNYDYSLSFTETKNVGGTGTQNPLNGDGTFKGSYNLSEGYGTDLNADFLLGFTKEFGVFSVDASFGGNTWRVNDHDFRLNSSNFIIRDFFSLSNGTNQTQGFGYGVERVNSLYGLAEFGYNGMFYLNFTGRTDWFSKLNPQQNSVFYPSISGSIIFSEFLPNVSSWLDYGKLRGSWAQTGSINGLGRYEGQLAYGIAQNQFNGQTTGSVNGGNAPNPDLLPYTVTEKEIGLDMRLLNNRLHVDVGAFEKVTTDQILSVQLSTASGFGGSKQNLGSLKNYGVETMIEYTPIQSKDFSWTTSWNNTWLGTEVTSVGVYPDGSPVEDFLLVDYYNGGASNEFLGQMRYTVGMPMNQLYTRTYLRNDDGDVVLRSNGRLRASDDYVAIGSSIPKYTGGWSNNFSYKNLSLGVLIDYKFGGTVISSTLLNMTRQGHSELSLVGRREGETGLIFPGVINTGTEESPTYVENTVEVTDLRGFYTDYRSLQIGDPFVFKSDFVKLRSISLSYNFTDMIRTVDFMSFFKGLTLTFSCRNVAILHKDIPNLDPEAIQSSGDSRSGYENSSMPTTRNYSFALNARF